ncbi:unnamed protein product [Rhizophagus irregularis]|nr:unnamed protein product [Rhizophagus irregularis]
MKKYYLDFENTNHLSLFTRGSAFRKSEELHEIYFIRPISINVVSIIQLKINDLKKSLLFKSGRDFGREDSGFLAPLKRAWTREISMVRSLDAWNFNKCGLRFVTAPCLTLVLRIQEVRLRWLLVLYDFERGFQFVSCLLDRLTWILGSGFFSLTLFFNETLLTSVSFFPLFLSITGVLEFCMEAVPVKINLWAIFIIKKITSDQMRME